MRFLLFSFFLLLSAGCIPAFSQPALPPVYTIVNDTARTIAPDSSYYQVLGDPKEERSFTEVLSPQWSRQFTGDASKYKDANGYVFRVTWLRYRVRNGMTKTLDLAFSSAIAKEDLYFLKPGGKWQHQVTGTSVPWSQKDGLKLLNKIVYSLNPGEEVLVYERQQVNWKRVSTSVQIEFAKRAIAAGYIDDRIQLNNSLLSLFAGMLLFAAMINFFFFYLIRERVYCYYGLTLLLGDICFYHFCVRDVLREYPQHYEDIGSTLLLLTIFFSIFAVRYFLQTRTHYPRWDKFLLILSWILLLGVPIAVNLPRDPYGIILSVPKVIVLCILSSLVITPLLFLGNKFQHAKLFLLAFFPLVVFLLILLVTLVLNAHWFSSWLAPGMLLSVAWLVSVLSWSLFVRFKNVLHENANQALEKETERKELIAAQKVQLEKEVEARTAELKLSLTELKAAQNQLIQSEKMASLGELTAGIAHEIQNPLNFVNNFSEVSIELIDELETELQNGDPEEVLALAGDIKQNLEKINHHGKRADSIVKGMLQHSKAGSGNREPTDLNTFIDECLRLSFHGLRAKDKSFNAMLKTDFDASIGTVTVLKQDLGRVFLNLFTNAFYSVGQKKRTAAGGYEPTVSVTTKKMDRNIEVRVWDNGTGIPQKILDKIYQPFFTTKPTGEGTGLGLSLSYDIITKGHGGTIDAHTEEGKFAEFVLKLPVQ